MSTVTVMGVSGLLLREAATAYGISTRVLAAAMELAPVEESSLEHVAYRTAKAVLEARPHEGVSDVAWLQAFSKQRKVRCAWWTHSPSYVLRLAAKGLRWLKNR